MKFDTINEYKKHLKKMYRGIHIFSLLVAVGLYLLISFANWSMNVSTWGGGSRLSLVLASVIIWVLFLIFGVIKEMNLDKINADLLPSSKHVDSYKLKKSTFQQRLEEEAKKRKNTN